MLIIAETKLDESFPESITIIYGEMEEIYTELSSIWAQLS
jgi:hypothetical protein